MADDVWAARLAAGPGGEPVPAGAMGRTSPYRLLTRLVEDGRGGVYVGGGTDGLAVLRLLRPAWLDEPDGGVPGLVRSLAAARRLPPDCEVGRVDDALLSGAECYVVSAFVSGPSLHDLVAERGALPPSLVADVAESCLNGLVLLHEAGLTHGAVEPRTMVVGPDGARLVGVALLPDAPGRQPAPNGAATRSDDARTTSLAAAQEGDLRGWAAALAFAATAHPGFLDLVDPTTAATTDLDPLAELLWDRLPARLARLFWACAVLGPADGVTARRLLELLRRHEFDRRLFTTLKARPRPTAETGPTTETGSPIDTARTTERPVPVPVPRADAVLPRPEVAEVVREQPDAAEVAEAPGPGPRRRRVALGAGALGLAGALVGAVALHSAVADPGGERPGVRSAAHADRASPPGPAPTVLAESYPSSSRTAVPVPSTATATPTTHVVPSRSGRAATSTSGRAAPPPQTPPQTPSQTPSSTASAAPVSRRTLTPTATGDAGATSDGRTVPQPDTERFRRCGARFDVVEVWPGGFKAQITVSAGEAPLDGWVVAWRPVPGQRLREGWRADFAVSGGYVVARSLDYDSSVPAGASTTFGVVVDADQPRPPDLMACLAPR